MSNNVNHSNINYFDKLYPLVMPSLIAYKDDFLVSDKKLLADYTGEFILGYRDTGTNLLLLNTEYLESVSRPLMFGTEQPGSVDQLIANVDAFLFSNQSFIFGCDGNVKVIDKEQAVKIFRSWLPAIDSYLNKKAA
jgi:hypothetical protein